MRCCNGLKCRSIHSAALLQTPRMNCEPRLQHLTLQIQLAARAQTEDDRALALERMEQGVKRATRLVQQLLTMARLDPEAAQKPAVPIDLATLATAVADELRPLAEQKSIVLEVDAPAPAWILGQEDALRILLTNLIDNAIRYTAAGRACSRFRAAGRRTSAVDRARQWPRDSDRRARARV